MLITLVGPSQRDHAMRVIQDAPQYSRVEIKGPRRSNDQNALMWVLLSALSAQTVYHGKKRSPEDWKDILSAAVRTANDGLELVPGINGGVVQLGQRTSQMTKQEMADLITLAMSVADQHGVNYETPDCAS